MADVLTPHLNLPLPSSTLEEDFPRIIQAFTMLDSKIHQLDQLLASDDVSLDTVQELVNAIKAEAGPIAALTTGKVNVGDVVNRLDDNSTNKPLSAAQGKTLKELVDGKAAQSHIHTVSDVNGLSTLVSTLVSQSLSQIQDQVNTMEALAYAGL